MLAGLPKAPSKFNPITNLERAKIRRDYVLNRMFQLKYIDEETLNAALEEPVTASKHIVKYAVDAPYVAEMVRQYVLKKYREQAYSGGLHIYTTIDAKHQLAATVAVRSGLMEYDQRHGYRGRVGRIKLTKNTEPELLDDTLREYPIIGDLIPAIIMEVKDKTLVAYTQDGETVEIEWEGLSWARRYKSEEEIACDLHGDGASPLTALSGANIGQGRPDDPQEVDAVMAIKGVILSCQYGVDQGLGDIFGLHWDPFFLPEFGDQGPIGGIDPHGYIQLRQVFDRWQRRQQNQGQQGQYDHPGGKHAGGAEE